MIKKLIIQHFKTYSRGRFRFHPGLNAIIGLPNAGKSNIRKAIEWVSFNSHPYKKVCSDFIKSPEPKVEITTNSDKISLKKTSKEGFYQINNEKPYRKFGTTVPDRITQNLNLHELNFTDQHDPPFLVTSSPPEIARTINRITNVSSIDKCVQAIGKHIYAIKQKATLLSSDCKLLKTKLKRLARIDSAKKYIIKAEEINKQIETNENEINDIMEIQENINRIQKVLKNKDKLDTAKEFIRHAEIIRKQLEQNYITLTICESVVQLNKTISIANQEKKERINEFVKVLHLQKRCPTCLSKITTKHIHDIREELS